MGTDIHPVVEVRQKDGSWRAVKPPTPRYDHEDPCWRWEFDRSYDSFAVMADVRNGYGCAGVDTGNGFVPIAEPRGIPKDFSLPDYYVGDHSFSWLTLAEIKAYDWTRRTKKRGVLDAKGYKEWREHRGWPKGGWSGGIMGYGVLNVSNEEMDAYLERPIKDGKERYTQVEWWADYKDCCKRLLDFVAELEAMNLGKANDVRIVFGFDS